MLVGVFVVSPLFARQLARVIGGPLTKLRGIVGSMSRENAARNPRRTATTGAAVMIAVSLVGFITIFAASANASIGSAIDQQLKTDYIVTLKGGGGGPGGAGLSPILAKQIAALPRDPGLDADPARLGRRSPASNTFLAAVDPAAVEPALRLRRCRAASIADLAHEHDRGLDPQGRQQAPEGRRHAAGAVRADGQASR